VGVLGSKSVPDGRREGGQMKRKEFSRLMSSKKLLTALRIIMGLVFVAASYDKLLYPAVFAAKAAEYKLIPELLLPVVAVALPWVELFCGFLLMLNIFTRSTALILAVTLAGFIFGMAYDLSFGLVHDCGCFGFLEESIGAGTIIRDLVFIAMLLPAIIYGGNEFALLPGKEK